MDRWLSLLGFAALMVGTPGPASFVLMAAGARWGLKSSLPFLLGIIAGKAVLGVALFVGLLTLLNAYPHLADLVKWVSAFYLLWLAWKVAGLRLTQAVGITQPPGFVAGLIVHPLNPKAWAMLSTAYTQFSNPKLPLFLQWLMVAGSFMLMQCIFHSLWCWGGVCIVKQIKSRVWERVIMMTLSLMIMAMVIWVLVQGVIAT